MRMPLVAGRTFDATDRADRPGVVILNQAAARAFLPAGDPIGRRVRLGPDPTAPWVVVVGVVGDAREGGLDAAVPPTVYVSHAQNSWWRSMVIVVRTEGDPRTAEAPLRRAVREADPRLAVRNIRTLDEVVDASLAARRFVLSLITSFAVVALALAAIGIYGVLAFLVASRTREFGVRLALGASRGGVLLLVLRQGVGWAALGAAIGTAGALAGGKLLAGMLYGVSATDLPTYLGVFGGVVLVVAAACAVPATRAMRVDPMTSMRAE
jgi:predicted permease